MTRPDIFTQRESAVRSYCRTFPTVFARACGAELFDADGRRYLDFLAGCGSLNYGHNDPTMKAALLEYIERDGVVQGLDMHTDAKAHFLEVFTRYVLEPRGFDHVVQFTGPTGTNAVEAAFKLARKVTGRTGIVSFTNGFHGVTLGSLVATGNGAHRRGAGLPLLGGAVMPYDGYLGPAVDTLDYFEKALSDPSSGVDLPAAVIVEAVQGEGGLTAAGARWLRRLERICRSHGVLLILDDIQAGCGRTGHFFGFEHAGIVPDLVTLSKSLSGSGLPMAVVLIRPEHDRWAPAEHNGTFRGNNLAFVTAAAAIETYWADDAFAEEVRAKGELLGRRLDGFVRRFSPDLVEVRGRGMMRGVRCADPARAAVVTERAFEHGLVIERSGPRDEVVKCLVPLTIPRAQLVEGLDVLERSFEEVFGARAPTSSTMSVAAGI